MFITILFTLPQVTPINITTFNYASITTAVVLFGAGGWHLAGQGMQSGEGSKVATTEENIPGARAEAGAADPARAERAPLQAMTSPGAAAFIGERGGSLYVWVTRFNCCGGAVRIVRSSTGAPRGLTDFRRFDAGGFQILLHPSIGRPPAQMQVRLRGRWRPRSTVYWDGIPI